MSRVITYSRVFPATHPRKGEPTYFVEQILKGLSIPDYWNVFWSLNSGVDKRLLWDFQGSFNYTAFNIKGHTIRAGNRWKVGDRFSPRVWGNDINPKTGRSGPYHSKQIIIAPDIELVKAWPVGKLGSTFFLNDKAIPIKTLEEICINDGLSWVDFHSWFSKAGIKEKWHGQILCWNENINY